MAPSTVAPPPSRTIAPRAAPAVAASEPELVRWLRPWIGMAVILLAVVTVLTAFADEMPASHHVAVPPAAAVIFAGWAVELSGRRWPRAGLIATNVLPNVWLALIHHGSANYLFLLLLVAWVGLVGSRAESVLALTLSLATVVLAAGLDAAGGTIIWSAWITSAVILSMVWLMALVLRRQERLVTELRALRSDAEQRNQELGTLLTVSRSVASTLEMSPLLSSVLDALGSVVAYRGTAILTLDEADDTLTFAHWRGPAAFTDDVARAARYRPADFGPAWERLHQDEPILIPDVHGETDEAQTFRRLVGEAELDTTYGFIRSVMWVPLIVGGRVIGLLSITSPAPNAYTSRDAALALAIARQAAIAIENARLHERARHAAVLEERQRLARELHDSVTQALYGVSLQAEAATRALAAGTTAPAAARLREIQATTQEALGETRLLLFELRPPLLEERGLAGALRARLDAVEARAGLTTELHVEVTERLRPETERELYRLAQEALNNVLKHAHARHVTVGLDVSTDRAALDVSDDGLGFEPELRGGGGFGLPGMRERAERLGGTLTVESAPGAGTRVRVEVPR